MQTQSVNYNSAESIAFRFNLNYQMAQAGASLSIDAELEEKRAVWRENPRLYAKERLGVTLTDQQAQIIESIRDNRRTAVMAHHSLGKTFVAAIAILWWIDCWNAHIGYITAPNWSQALSLTFKQAKRLAMLNKLDFEILDSGIIRDRDKFKQTERFAKALNAEKGEGFQGEHTAPILIIVDEAIGVPNYIYDAMEGLMTHPECRWCLIFNPTDEATRTGELCESLNVETLSFSALDHPNIIAELRCQSRPFTNAVSLLWLFEMLRDEAEEVSEDAEDCFEFYALEEIEKALNGQPVNKNSRKCFYKPTGYFQGRALGEFPTEASSKVIPKGWLKNLPDKQVNPNSKAQIGCDTARFGDDRTTIFARIGQVVISGRVIRKFDNVAVTNAIKEVVEEVIKYFKSNFGITITKKDVSINIDTTGGLGTAPYDYLKADGYNVNAINSSETAKNEEKYINIRSELWFDVRDRFKDKEIDYSRLDLDIKRVLERELSTPLYKVNSKGKKVVEDKAEIKKRLGASPDLADGFNLAFYEVPVKKKASFYSE